jgi:endoglucanase
MSMRTLFRTLLALVALLLLPGIGIAQKSDSAVILKRGINIGDYLAYPGSDVWPLFRGPRTTTTDAELQRLSAAGFDFVRLAVEPAPFLDRSAGEVAELEERLASFVRRITAAGMRVMVTGWARHETTPRWRAGQILANRDGAEFRNYLGFLKRIVWLLRDIPQDRWVLEPMNEPQIACRRTDGPDWTVLQRDIYNEIRAVAPSLTVVLTPGCWSGLRGLAHLDMAGYDARTLVDFHYYEPHPFTHQGTTWGDDALKSLAGLAFPPAATDRQAATDASGRLFLARGAKGGAAALVPTLREIDDYIRTDRGQAHIEAGMATVKAWADKNGVTADRVTLGEFGVYRQPPEAKVPDDGSRLRWLETVRKAAEARGFGWALFAYHSSFGLVTDDATARWDDAMLPALGLKVPWK